MGHGGAGKSTLCYCLNSIVPRFFRGSYKGKVFVRGIEVASKKVAEMSRHVGLVLQDFEAQLFSTNVELEMAFGPENHCVPRNEIKRRMDYYLPVVGLEGMRNREPSTLSGGQKQRLAIGSVLMMETPVLVMDEPGTDLDPRGYEEVMEIGKGLRKGGRTIIIVDSEPENAIYADLIWLMKDGNLVAKGSPKEILGDKDLLTHCGVRTHSIIDLFSAMGWPGSPITPEDAISIIDRYKLLNRDKSGRKVERSQKTYGAPVIQVEALEYIYPFPNIRALNGIDLKISEGEFVAILGQNGSGKSTLAKHFNGILKPTGGQVLVQGKPTTSYTRKELARKVGYVFQNPDHQIFGRTVEEEVAFSLKVLGMDSGEIERRVRETLDVVGLKGYEKRIPFTLTKGERQRVAVASVLASQPQVIVLDEPTTGLDYQQQRSMMEMLRRLNNLGHTIIIITHSMWVAAEYAERTVVMKDGSIILDGPTRKVFQSEDTLLEASLLPPPIVRIANYLGLNSMTVEGIMEEIKR
jgi:energy-coupling factor transport system ATP-binding protein